MDFFQAQDQARRRSRWLVLACLGAAALVVASYCAVAALLYAAWAKFWLGAASWPHRELMLGVAGVVATLIVSVSA